jgi:hypothetical protein
MRGIMKMGEYERLKLTIRVILWTKLEVTIPDFNEIWYLSTLM